VVNIAAEQSARFHDALQWWRVGDVIEDEYVLPQYYLWFGLFKSPIF
jgi:hypothetical protein